MIGNRFGSSYVGSLTNAFAFWSLLISSSIFAQDDVILSGISEAENRTIYDAAYFGQYNVTTARDQLESIPGLHNLLGDSEDERGFGSSGDQVLINGERISGKSNDIASVLDRIQARQVVRIEVIHGPEAGLDVRGQGPFANVVTDGALDAGYGAWKAEWRHYADGYDQYALGFNYTGNVGDVKYLFSAEADPESRRTERKETFFVNDEPLERQAEFTLEDTKDYVFIANTAYGFQNGDLLNVNALYELSDQIRDDLSARFEVTGLGENYVRDANIERNENGDSWELGGDYSHQLANGDQFKFLFLFSSQTNEEVNTFTAIRPNQPVMVTEKQKENREDAERILRSTYRWGITESSSFESGIELAYNSLDLDVRLFENIDGELAETALFNQNSTVEESRVEAFTAYSTRLRSDLFLETSLDVELSEISQSGGDISRARDFSFLRPRVVIRHDLSESGQLSGRFERSISQLDFEDFVSSFSTDDNRSGVVSAGNPELVPEKAWEYELLYRQRLGGDLGMVSVKGLYQDIEDHVAPLPLLVTDDAGVTEVRTATGNIGDATKVSLTLEGSLRLGWINMPGVLVEGDFVANESSVTDPFTGKDMDLYGVPDFEWSFGFTHDTNWKTLSYGITAEQRGIRRRSDLDYEQWQDEDPDLKIFAEVKPFANVTMRLEAEDALEAENRRERIQFDGIRSDGALLRREERIYNETRSVIFSIQGTF